MRTFQAIVSCSCILGYPVHFASLRAIHHRLARNATLTQSSCFSALRFLISSNSTSKIRVAFPGITPPAPRSPGRKAVTHRDVSFKLGQRDMRDPIEITYRKPCRRGSSRYVSLRCTCPKDLVIRPFEKVKRDRQ